MKKFVILMFTLVSVAIGSAVLDAAVYEASTLHNAVSRSETVQDLFFQRWEDIQNRELYVDVYGKLNWIPGFKVSTVNSGSGEKETHDMTLVRTYGSVTVNYPILGGYEGTIGERLQGKKKGKDEEKGSGPFGLWKPDNLIIGFTATGFHYGLTRSTEINRGDAGSETVTDYKYSQFFDDMFVLAVRYRPYFDIHGGIILSREIEPRDDGTMDYFDSVESDVRYFISSSVLSFLNVNATTTKDKFEAMAVSVKLNQLIGFLVEKPSPLIPEVKITYKLLNLYNDEAYDAVWVKTATGKSDDMDDSAKDEAALHTYALDIKENLYDMVILTFHGELQHTTHKLIDKKDDDTVHLDIVRDFHFMAGYNFLSDDPEMNLTASLGVSRYWDPAISFHRESGDGYALWGGIFAITFDSTFFGADLRVSRNYSTELRKLVESSDKWMLEASLFGRI